MTGDQFPYRTSFWCEQEPPRLAPLEGSAQVDVAVIGGGYAGLSSARCLKEADPSLRVALLESEYIGFGASGRNGGFLSPLPPVTWLLTDATDRRRMEDLRWAMGYIRQQEQELGGLIDREGIDCEFRTAPVITTATRGAQWALLKWMADRCQALGVSVRTMSEANLQDAIRYRIKGGLAIDGHAVHPYRLARGLLQVILRRGVLVYEGTRVGRMVPGARGVELHTDTGARMLAGKVVLATNAYTPRLGSAGQKGLFPMPCHTYSIATQPLQEDVLKRLGFGDNLVGDTGASLWYGRVYRNRLLFGGLGRFRSKADLVADRNAGAYLRLHAEMLRYFPFLADAPIEAAWGGPLHQTLTDTPRVRPAPGNPDVVLNVGYASEGVALTQFSGKLVTGLVLGERYADHDADRLRRIYDSTRVPVGAALKLGLRFMWNSVFAR